VAGTEPERALIRRALPFGPPIAALAFVVAALVADVDAGWSAAIAVAVVFANFVAHGWSLAWAARISPVVLYAVALGGFIVRLGVIVAIIVALRQLPWFSTGAFVAALVPTTIALLAFEMNQLSGRLQVDMWTLPTDARGARR
jgi:hypothetical protein